MRWQEMTREQRREADRRFYVWYSTVHVGVIILFGGFVAWSKWGYLLVA